MSRKKEDPRYMRCQAYYTSEENARIMRAHRRYEEEIRAELGMESQIIDELPKELCRKTRLERSRVLMSDEDNLYSDY